MKEFDKWQKKHGSWIWLGVPIDEDISEGLIKQGWEAALQWALSYEYPTEIKERILDELKEIE